LLLFGLLSVYNTPGAGVKQLLHVTGNPSAPVLWHLLVHNRPWAMHLQFFVSAQSFLHWQNVFPPSLLYSFLASPILSFFLKSTLLVSILRIAAVMVGSNDIIWRKKYPSKYPCCVHKPYLTPPVVLLKFVLVTITGM